MRSILDTKLNNEDFKLQIPRDRGISVQRNVFIRTNCYVCKPSYLNLLEIETNPIYLEKGSQGHQYGLLTILDLL